MDITVQNKEQIVTFSFSNGEKVDVTLDSYSSRSLLNKFHFLVQDIEKIEELDPTFENVYYNILTDVFSMTPAEVVKTLSHYAKLYVEHLDIDYEKFADKSKKTKSSVFFEPEEVKQVTELIVLMKLLTPLLHSSFYQSIVKQILHEISLAYKVVNTKLYQMIKFKLKFNFYDRNALEFLKYTMTTDYLILYNFDFVMMTSVLFFDFTKDMNPISFIISVASDNANFLTLSYSATAFDYVENIEDIQKKNLLYAIGDQLLLNRMYTIAMHLLERDGKSIVPYLEPTVLYDYVVVPILSMVTGISKNMLYEFHEKLYIQWLFYYIVSNSKKLSKEIRSGKKLLIFGLEKVTKGSKPNVNKPILKVLINEVVFKGLVSKQPIIDYAKNLTNIPFKDTQHIITETPNTMTKQELEESLSDLISFVLKLIDDKTSEMLLEEFRKEFHKILQHHKILESEFRNIAAMH